MRVGLVALVILACGVARANEAAPAPAEPTDQSGVTINLDALPSSTPQTPPPRPLSLARPRPKPELSAPGEDSDGRVEGSFALPREKPVDVAAVAPTPPKPSPAAERPPVAATPPAQPQVPVTIVSSSTKAFPVEISGVAADPFAGAKHINPLEGFAVLSRVRFLNGKADIPAQAQAALNAVAERLATSQVRVRLAAFSGQAGDLSSDARRLSLARALAIRAYLNTKGVSTERVDVLAFGGATDGITDRVDVLMRGT